MSQTQNSSYPKKFSSEEHEGLVFTRFFAIVFNQYTSALEGESHG
jgi:hypothetical protein